MMELADIETYLRLVEENQDSTRSDHVENLVV